MCRVITWLWVVILSLAPAGVFAEVIQVASFNIHYIVPADPEENWPVRRQSVTSILKQMNADIISFQEMETFRGGSFNEDNLQLSWVLDTVPGYKAAAAGPPEQFPSTQPVLYKTSRFAKVEQGYFFFSATPDIIYSRQWNGSYPYFCSWVQLRSRATGQILFLFNLHNDYQSRSNRVRTSMLVRQRIAEIVPPGVPVIITGDFNAPVWFRELDILREAGFSVAEPSGSTNRIMGMNLIPAIDHILYRSPVQVQNQVTVWRDKPNGIYPSDHYPISAKFELP